MDASFSSSSSSSSAWGRQASVGPDGNYYYDWEAIYKPNRIWKSRHRSHQRRHMHECSSPSGESALSNTRTYVRNMYRVKYSIYLSDVSVGRSFSCAVVYIFVASLRRPWLGLRLHNKNIHSCPIDTLQWCIGHLWKEEQEIDRLRFLIKIAHRKSTSNNATEFIKHKRQI